MTSADSWPSVTRHPQPGPMTADGETAPPSVSSVGRSHANAEARLRARTSSAYSLSRVDPRLRSCRYVLLAGEASRTRRCPSRGSGVNQAEEAGALLDLCLVPTLVRPPDRGSALPQQEIAPRTARGALTRAPKQDFDPSIARRRRAGYHGRVRSKRLGRSRTARVSAALWAAFAQAGRLETIGPTSLHRPQLRGRDVCLGRLCGRG